jgi:hypothetical protein
MPKNAGKYSSNQVASIKSAIAGAWKKEFGEEPPAASKLMGSALIKVIGENLSKHLYDVGEVACMILRLKDLATCLEMEAVREGDNSRMADQLKVHIASLCEFLRNLVEEETTELVEGVEDMSGYDDDDVDGDDAAVQIFVRAAVGPNAAQFAKALEDTIGIHEDALEAAAKEKGLKYNKSKAVKLIGALKKVGHRLGQVNRMHLQAAHDHLSSMTDGEVCEMGDAEKWTKAGAKLSRATKEKIKAAHDHLSDLGADCTMGKGVFLMSLEGEVRDFEKGHGLGGGQLGKILEENGALKRALADVAPAVKELVTRVAKLEKTPEPRRVYINNAGGGHTPDSNGRGNPPPVFTLDKSGDSGSVFSGDFSHGGATGQSAIDKFTDYLSTLSEEARAIELIKLAQRSPQFRQPG